MITNDTVRPIRGSIMKLSKQIRLAEEKNNPNLARYLRNRRAGYRSRLTRAMKATIC